MVQEERKKRESEQKAREHNREQILQQIERIMEKRKTEAKISRAVPDIAGNRGYPPIYEPSQAQMRDAQLRMYAKEREALVQQVFAVRRRQNRLARTRRGSEGIANKKSRLPAPTAGPPSI